MDYKQYLDQINEDSAPARLTVRRYEALKVLGKAITDAWREMGFDVKGLSFDDIVVPSTLYSPYIHVSDTQLEPLTEDDIRKLMSVVEVNYGLDPQALGESLSYVRQSPNQLEISIPRR